MMAASTPFSFPIRVYYEDTDFSGAVYHANYLKFLERGRTEFIREQALEQEKLSREHGLHFVVHHMDITFHKAAKMDDELTVTTTISTLKAARIIMEQYIMRTTEKLVSAHVTLALINKNGRPQKISNFITALF